MLPLLNNAFGLQLVLRSLEFWPVVTDGQVINATAITEQMTFGAVSHTTSYIESWVQAIRHSAVALLCMRGYCLHLMKCSADVIALFCRVGSNTFIIPAFLKSLQE